MVCELTGSKSCLAIIYGVNSIPTILFQTFEGALDEFFDKKSHCYIMRYWGGGYCTVYRNHADSWGFKTMASADLYVPNFML